VVELSQVARLSKVDSVEPGHDFCDLGMRCSCKMQMQSIHGVAWGSPGVFYAENVGAN
jgi:hypothetical protein